VRFALVGCGVIAPTHARALRQLGDRAELAYCCDVVPERAAALADEFDLKTVQLPELLADKSVDAVSVCTPSGLHAEVGVAALRAGKHVVVEKPMDVTVEACDRLLEAQRASGTQLGVISQNRFDLAAQAVKKAIDDGGFGPLVLVEGRVLWFRAQDYYDSGAWRGTWELDGGGCLMNQGVHTVDLMRWLCGPVRSVYAQTRTAAHARIEVEDVACATLVFENGALGTIVASTGAYPGFPAHLAVFGTAGGAVIEGGRLASLGTVGQQPLQAEEATDYAVQLAQGGTRRAADLAVRPAGTPVSKDDAWGEGHRRQLLDFVASIEEGRPPLVDGTEGRHAVELVCAIYKSARAGRVVNL
jgi:predicted dehydrogenase